jgi:hypothetical protein
LKTLHPSVARTHPRVQRGSEHFGSLIPLDHLLILKTNSSLAEVDNTMADEVKYEEDDVENPPTEGGDDEVSSKTMEKSSCISEMADG